MQMTEVILQCYPQSVAFNGDSVGIQTYNMDTSFGNPCGEIMLAGTLETDIPKTQDPEATLKQFKLSKPEA
jgi:hypothetical protein